MNQVQLYNTKIFTEIWDNKNDFISDLKETGLINIKDDSLNVLYMLLYARYGNSPIANNDVYQFKAKVASIIFQYGPTWEKRLDVQKKIRELTEEDIFTGTKAIYNHAYNPSIEPGTSSLEEIPEINEQNTTNFKKSKLEGYSMLLDLLETDVTGEFINKFKICFKQFVMPERIVWYASPSTDGEAVYASPSTDGEAE